MKSPLFHPSAPREEGLALVVILAFIVMLTVVAVAFFSMASSERQISNASSQQVRSLSLAKSATEDVIGMLKDEMLAGSIGGAEYSASGSTDLAADDRCLVPVSPQTSRPFRFPGAAGNVWKWSQAGQPFYAGADYNTSAVPPFAGASTLDSASSSSSRNGRFVSAGRWQAPALADAADLPQPQWIYLARSGAKPLTWSEPLKNPAPSNADAVVGRYAFILYQTGGLLDVNVAGYPAASPVAEVRRKSGLSFADLSVLDPALTALPAWRDAVSGLSFPTRALGGATTFLRASPGDRLFVSRRQMLAYLRSIGAREESLRLLTHFTREKNAPSWGPLRNANDAVWGGSSSFAYRDSWNASTSANRLIPNVRVSTSHTLTSYDVNAQPFTRTVKAGEPLVSRRFSLDKLAWLTRSGPGSGISPAAIQAVFGLRWNSGRWEYVGATGSAALSEISTLADVAAAQREPNFFELLKAGILEGSLGMTTSPVPLGGDIIGINDWLPYNGGSTPRGYNASLLAGQRQLIDSHVIQLGLNILDQADTDSFPSRILFRGFEFYGTENIPYLYRFSQIPYRPQSAFAGMTPPGPDRRMVTAWLEPALWNPLRGAVNDAPTRYRIRMVAGTLNYYFRQTQSQPTTTSAQIGPTSPAASALAAASIEFTGPALSASASSPANLVQLGASVSVPRPEYHFTGDGQNWIGFWGGEAPIALGEDLTHGIFTLNGSPSSGGPRFVLEVDYGGGDFREVQRFGFGATGGLWFGVSGATYDRCRVPGRRAVQFGFNDPRTNRFGNQGFDFGGDRPDLLAASQFWSASQTFNGQYNPKDANFTPPDPVANPWFARASYRYADNSGAGSGPVYTDRDGVRRPGDGTWSSASSNTLPMRQQEDCRPVQLNRPFRNPGELGVVFRDLPWKSLDFSSGRSGDSALLDLFCVGSEGDQEGLLAGRLDVNTHQPAVLAALLAGASRVETTPGLSIPSTSTDLPLNVAEDLAGDIVAATTATPVRNRADLVEVIQQAIDASALASNIKSRQEVALRALSQPGQTRTWTFLLDLVAQSGRMATNADGFEDFLVDGERRVWAHIAIDRFTSQVIDLELEQVDE